ncbi:MAG: methyltransferase [Pelagibacterales bacterium]|nr:methyltransferase [Pelagibacterales bacterium]
MKLNVFTPIKNLTIKYYSNDTVFKPTRTSVLIIKGIEKNKKIFTKYKTLIDLGCGTGILGISLKNIFKKIDVTFADQSSKAVNLTKKNLKFNKIESSTFKSDLFKNIPKKNFDIIINDVAGISNFFEKIGFWYNKNIPCNTGLDGTLKTIEFLNSIPKETKIIVMPLISLSNIKKIKSFLVKKKLKYKLVLKEFWPLPKKLLIKHSEKLKNLKKKNFIDYNKKFGMYLAYTEILIIKKI